MPLSDSEITRVKKELGYSLITSDAPYVEDFTLLFEQIIQPYLEEGADTTSSTTVTAADSPTPVTLTLTSASGFYRGDRAFIDVDSRLETPTIQSVSGSTITVLLSLDHTGTYGVTVEGGLTTVRNCLRELSNLETTISRLRTRVGIKKAEDIEFFGGGATLASQGIDPFTQVLQLRETWRDELALALGIRRLNGPQRGGGASLSLY
jgi:hypothetical protein